MKHGKKFRSLSRTSAHRKALLANLAKELIKHKRIKTTLPKAKELRKFIEPLITKSKNDITHNRRMVFKNLKGRDAKESVSELFRNIAPKVADRPGGYTRIIKLGPRLGDNAEMCIIELVDFNTILTSETATTETKTRRSRRGRKGGKKNETTTEASANTENVSETVTDAEVIEEANEVVEEEVSEEIDNKVEDSNDSEENQDEEEKNS